VCCWFNRPAGLRQQSRAAVWDMGIWQQQLSHFWLVSCLQGHYQELTHILDLLPTAARAEAAAAAAAAEAREAQLAAAESR